MGSKNSQQSASEFGIIFICTEKPVYQPGELVTGNISLQLYKEYPAESLQLQISGFQKATIFQENQTEPQGKDKKRLLFNRINIFKPQHASIPQGQHTFPFRFLLPQGLPDSISINNKLFIASVEYNISAILKSTKKSKVQAMISTCGFMIRIHSPDIEIKACGILEMGRVSLSLFLPKNYFTQTEPVNAIFSIDNSNCKSRINKVECSLILKLEAIIKKNQHIKSHVLLTQNFQGVEPKSTQEQQVCNLELKDCNKSGEVNPAGLTIHQFLSTQLPHTHNSAMFKVRYILKLRAVYESAFICGAKSAIAQEVIVQPPLLPEEEQKMQVPEGWNPQIYQERDIDIIAQPVDPTLNMPVVEEGGYLLNSNYAPESQQRYIPQIPAPIDLPKTPYIAPPPEAVSLPQIQLKEVEGPTPEYTYK